MPLLPLDGFTIGVTADRRSEEQAELLRRRGAEVVRAPTITTTYLASERRLREATAALLDDPPDYLVVTTAIGLRAWLEAAQSWGLSNELLAALRQSRVVARGPKAAAAAQTAGLEVWRTAPDERMDGVHDLLRDVAAGAHVAVQCFGDDVETAARAAVGPGVRSTLVPVYRWEPPADAEPARGLVAGLIDGRVHAVTFTSAPAVRGLFDLAGDDGTSAELLAAFDRSAVAACVGPACADAARDRGVSRPVAPEVGRLGLMVRALSDALQSRRRVVRLADVTLELQGRVALVGAERIPLTSLEAGVLEVLARKPGAVVSTNSLVRSVWRDGLADPRVVATTVGRLRRKLGSNAGMLRAVPRRGYRLET